MSDASDRSLDRVAPLPAVVALVGLLAVALLGVPVGILMTRHVEPVLLAVAVTLMAASWSPIAFALSTGFRSLSLRWVFPALACALIAIALEVVAFLL